MALLFLLSKSWFLIFDFTFVYKSKLKGRVSFTYKSSGIDPVRIHVGTTLSQIPSYSQLTQETLPPWAKGKGWLGWLAGWAWLGGWAGLDGWSGVVGWAGYGSMGLLVKLLAMGLKNRFRHIHIHMHIYTCIHICTRIYTFVHVCLYTYIYLCVCRYIYIYIYSWMEESI